MHWQHNWNDDSQFVCYARFAGCLCHILRLLNIHTSLGAAEVCDFIIKQVAEASSITGWSRCYQDASDSGQPQYTCILLCRFLDCMVWFCICERSTCHLPPRKRGLTCGVRLNADNMACSFSYCRTIRSDTGLLAQSSPHHVVSVRPDFVHWAIVHTLSGVSFPVPERLEFPT